MSGRSWFDTGSVISTNLEAMSLESRVGVLGALSDPIRLSILDELSRDQRCVCELQELLDIAPNLLSYHLRILREAEMVAASRGGRWVDYHLAEDAAGLIGLALPVELLAEVVS